MSLLQWNADLGGLADLVQKGEIRVLLQRGRLALPRLNANVGPTALGCAALVTIGNAEGLRVEAQGTGTPDVVRHTLSGGVTGVKTPYTLRGVDADGGQWRIRDARLRSSMTFVTGGASFSLTPFFTNISSNVFPGVPLNTIEIAVPSSAELPALRLDRRSGNQVPTDDGSGELTSEDLEIRHKVVGDMRVISMRCLEGIRPFDQAQRLLDALSFVNGFQVLPRFIRRIENGKGILSIFRRKSIYDDAQALPPFEMSSNIARVGAWNAIELYLRFCVPAANGKRPMISRCVSQLQGAYRSMFLSNKALAAAVAVEGLISKFVRRDLVPIWPKSKRARWLAWLDAADIPADVATRLKSSIGQTKSRSTTALLRALSDRGVVGNDLVTTWSQQRPRHAHGAHGTSEEELASFFCSVSIFNAVVLSIVGYVGDFRAYGVNGSVLASSGGRPAGTFSTTMR